MADRQMIELAARAVGRIDRDGLRGVTLVSTEEIWAMALTLVRLGLVAVQPGTKAPDVLIVPPPTNSKTEEETMAKNNPKPLLRDLRWHVCTKEDPWREALGRRAIHEDATKTLEGDWHCPHCDCRFPDAI